MVKTTKLLAKKMPMGDIPMPRKGKLHSHKLRKSITPGKYALRILELK